MAGVINGKGDLTWKVPLPPLSPTDIEPVSAALDPGDEAARLGLQPSSIVSA